MPKICSGSIQHLTGGYWLLPLYALFLTPRTVRAEMPQAFGISPRRLAMILSTMRFGSIDPISCWIGSGVIW